MLCVPRRGPARRVRDCSRGDLAPPEPTRCATAFGPLPSAVVPPSGQPIPIDVGMATPPHSGWIRSPRDPQRHQDREARHDRRDNSTWSGPIEQSCATDRGGTGVRQRQYVRSVSGNRHSEAHEAQREQHPKGDARASKAPDGPRHCLREVQNHSGAARPRRPPRHRIRTHARMLSGWPRLSRREGSASVTVTPSIGSSSSRCRDLVTISAHGCHLFGSSRSCHSLWRSHGWHPRPAR